jgi:hypothetical protein
MMICRRLLLVAVVFAGFLPGLGTATAGIVFHVTFPFSSDVLNECTGEYVYIEGEVHLYLTEVVGEDGTVRLKQNGNASGWGVGSISGAKYRYDQNFHFTQIITPGVAQSQTADIHTRLIGLGQTPNERMVYTFRFDVDESGTATTSMSDIAICQGD